MEQNGTLSEDELSERQLIAIPHLISSKSISEAAELAGVGRTTIHRWLNDDTFRAAYEEQRDAVAQYARSGMRSLMLKALSIQAQRLDSDDPKERARAAQAIMDYDRQTARTHENQKVIDRLHNLMFGPDNQPTNASERSAHVDQHVRDFRP